MYVVLSQEVKVLNVHLSTAFCLRLVVVIVANPTGPEDRSSDIFVRLPIVHILALHAGTLPSRVASTVSIGSSILHDRLQITLFCMINKVQGP